MSKNSLAETVVLTCAFCYNTCMQVDFYRGGAEAVIILTGLGGNNLGHDGKYAKIAEKLNKERNASIFVFATPENCWDNPAAVFENAVNCVYSQIKPEKIYVFGNSAGANLAICYSYLFPNIKKVVAVNPVLNLNIDRTKNGVLNFKGEKLLVAVGEKDSSRAFLPCVPQKRNVRTITVAEADHLFTNMTDNFVQLSDQLFTE